MLSRTFQKRAFWHLYSIWLVFIKSLTRSDIENLNKDTTFYYENYEGEAPGDEYGTRVNKVSPYCGKNSLRLRKDKARAFYGGKISYRDGEVTPAIFDAKKYPFVSMTIEY